MSETRLRVNSSMNHEEYMKYYDEPPKLQKIKPNKPNTDEVSTMESFSLSGSSKNQSQTSGQGSYMQQIQEEDYNEIDDEWTEGETNTNNFNQQFQSLSLNSGSNKKAYNYNNINNSNNNSGSIRGRSQSDGTIIQGQTIFSFLHGRNKV